MNRKKGFTLVELLISVSLLAMVSLVSVNIITSLLRSSVKAQMAVDVEQASSFVFLKLENDIKKSYSAQVTGTSVLTLYQGSPSSPVSLTYTLAGSGSGYCNTGLSCVLLDGVKLTDDSIIDGKISPFAVTIDTDPASSAFSIITNTAGDSIAVNVKITFIKPNSSGAKIFDAETVLDTTVVLRGSY